MLYIAIDQNQNAVGEPFTEGSLRERLGHNVHLPTPIKDKDINSHGFACVESTLSDLQQDKTTYLKPTVIKNTEEDADTLFTREWQLVPYPDNIDERVSRKFAEIRQKRDQLLAETDFAAADDYFYMKDVMTAYRNALRDLPEQDDDPFLISFPERPIDPKGDTSLEGLKQYALYKCEEKFRRTLYNVPPVDTGLGFSVVGGNHSYALIKGARDMGVNIVFDIDNVKRELSAEDMSTVVLAIEQHTLQSYNQKKETEAAIAAADEESIDTILRSLKL